MTRNNSILNEASEYVQQYLIDHLPAARLFHNYDHTQEVVEVAQDLAKAAKLSEEEKEMLLLAAWFHDCGFALDASDVAGGSVRVFKEFAKDKVYPEQRIAQVEQLIRSIHEKPSPSDNLEKILHDANNSYLGRKRFFRRSRLLRLEKEVMENAKYDLHEWNKIMLDMLINHKFYTPWAQEAFSKRRNKNAAEQRENILKARKKTIRKKTGKEFGRGVDTLYRVTLRNHIELSNIADGKANMIISINTLVLSILITAGAAGISFDNMVIKNLRFTIPILILMLTALTTIIFAVLSAMPDVSSEEFDEEAFQQNKVSMLFFGNFLQIKKAAFVEHLRDLKRNQELLYDDLSKDLYNLGAVLQKKYRLLTISYRVFVSGLVLSFVVFLVLMI